MQVARLTAPTVPEPPTYGPYSSTTTMMYDVCATLDSHRNVQTINTQRLQRDTLQLISAFKTKIARLPGEHILLTLAAIAVLLKKLNKPSDFLKLLCQVVYDGLSSPDVPQFSRLYKDEIAWTKKISIQSLFDTASQSQHSEDLRYYSQPLPQKCDGLPELHPLRLLSVTQKTTIFFDYYALCYWLHVSLPDELSGQDLLIAPVASWVNDTPRDPIKIIHTLSILSFFDLFRDSLSSRFSKLSVTALSPSFSVSDLNSWLQLDPAYTLLRELLINEHIVDSKLVLTLLETKYRVKCPHSTLPWLSNCDEFDADVLIDLIDAKGVPLEQILVFHQIVIHTSKFSKIGFGTRLNIATSIITRCSSEEIFLTRSDGGVCVEDLFVSLLLLKTEAETEQCLDGCRDRINLMIDHLCQAKWRVDTAKHIEYKYVRCADRIKEIVQAVAEDTYKTAEPKIDTCCIDAFYSAIKLNKKPEIECKNALVQAMFELYERIPEDKRRPEIQHYFVELATSLRLGIAGEYRIYFDQQKPKLDKNVR